MSTFKNEAAWINEKQARVVVGPAETHTPGAGELLVKVEVAAFHPLDAKLQLFDFFGLPVYPTVFGGSLGGTVVALGYGVTGFSAGDKVIATQPTYIPPYSKESKRYGAFQRYVIAIARNVVKLDSSSGYTLLEAIPISTQAAVAAFALGHAAALPHRPGHGAKANETVLIWGAGTVVGGYAVQYAAQAGYTVVATASSGEHARVKDLGATAVYDYRADEAQLVVSLKKHAPYATILDCSAAPSSLRAMFQLFEAGKEGTIFSMGPDREKIAPPNVTVSYRPYVGSAFDHATNGEFIDFLWKDWLANGLRKKTIKPQKSLVIRGGLDKVQECLDTVLTSKGAQVVLELTD